MKIKLLLCIVLVAATISVYWQTGENGFIDFDDNNYIELNHNVTSGLTQENVFWAFTATHAANWHPLTWVSHMVDCQLYGQSPRGHHLTNVIIHSLSALLLFLLLARITVMPWQSFFVASLFALHPLHVESVAWVSERKDVLSGFFWILTLLLYAKYVRTSDRKVYLLTLCSFVAGLMSKPMLVSLPIIMLLLDFWPFYRFQYKHTHMKAGSNCTAFFSFQQLLVEKVPFLFFSLLSSIITIYAQNIGRSLVSLQEIPFIPRLENALVAYAKYILQAVWPHDLAIFYPFQTPPLWQVACSLLLLITISLLSFRNRERFQYLIVGWLWFLITLLPVIGLVQVGDQSSADRYTYIPLVGLFIMFSWGVSDFLAKYRYNKYFFKILVGMVFIICIMLTNHQLSYWKSEKVLFTHAIDITKSNYKAYHALGVISAKERNFEEAFRYFSTAINIIPNSDIPYYDMGVALEASGRLDAAASYYKNAISINPGNVEAHSQLGGILCRGGHFQEAFTNYSTAIQLNPDYKAAYIDLAACRRFKSNN